MTAKKLSELINQLCEIYRQRFSIEYQRSRLLDHQGHPISSKDKEEGTLRNQINELDNKIRQKLEEWTKEQIVEASQHVSLVPSQPLVFEPQIKIDLSMIKDAFPVGKRVRFGHVNVPIGQIFVFGQEALDESGFAEVHLGGETILFRKKDKNSLVAALAEAPGEIRCISNQWLAGISVSKENVAKISIQIPVTLHDPLQTLKRSGGAWMFENGRRNIDHDLCELIEHRLQEILADDIQFWSGKSPEILDKICMALNRDLGEWGLLVKAESVSIVRQLPKTLYEIILQFSKAEQTILDSLSVGQKALVIDQSSLSADDLIRIEVSSESEDSGRGQGLFLVLRDRMPMLGQSPASLTKVLNWLRILGGASAANYLNEITRLYSRTTMADFDPTVEPGVSNIRLSEQVLLSAFRNPLIGLGESIERKE